MKTIDYSYFIERYNSGEMDTIEKRWFEKELNGNDNLQKEVKLRKKVDDALVHHDLINLRNKLISIEKERKEKLAASAAKKAAGIRFAAAVAALMVIGTFYLFTTSHNPDRLYDRNFQVYQVNDHSRTTTWTGSLSEEFASALELYNEGNFTAAAGVFRSCLAKMPQNMEASLLYGVSEMQNTNFPDAKSAFRTVIDHNSNLYIDNAQWYLALCYIKTGESDQAARQLQAIVNSESSYKARAKKLLKKVR